MLSLKRSYSVALAVIFGLLTLIGLVAVPSLADIILGWAALLATVALVLGVLNLFRIHGRRAADGNFYSGVLVLSMLVVFGLALTDAFNLTTGGVTAIFTWIQIPLEAAMSSLLAFFLVLAGARLLQHKRNGWSILFLASALFFAIVQAPLPTGIQEIVEPIRSIISTVLVTAGVRGLLLGVAIGVILLSLRVLVGLERPYSQ